MKIGNMRPRSAIMACAIGAGIGLVGRACVKNVNAVTSETDSLKNFVMEESPTKYHQVETKGFFPKIQTEHDIWKQAAKEIQDSLNIERAYFEGAQMVRDSIMAVENLKYCR